MEDRRIAKIGKLSSSQANRVIDADGSVVAPGFIDIHNHSEVTILVNPKCDNMVRQGITTMIVGNCGFSTAPVSELSRDFINWDVVKPEWETFREYFDRVEKQGVSTNIASLAGHGYIRSAVMGYENRMPTTKELLEMKALLAKAIADGAIGLSTGLGYPPGCYADTDEIVELCKVVARYGGYHATHVRDTKRKEHFLESINETILISEKSGCPLHISHIETHYDSWGLQDESIKLVEKAREKGLDVTFDVCVGHLHSGSWLAGAVMPFWAFEGGSLKMLERLKDAATREKMKVEMIETRIEPNTSDGFWERYIVLSTNKHPEFVGKNMLEISEAWGKDPWDAAYDLLLDEGEKCGGISLAKGIHNEEDMRTVLKHPLGIPETDGGVTADYGPYGDKLPHPRSYGNMALLFRKYVRGEANKDLHMDVGIKLITLEDAVRKITSLPAQRLGLSDRGLLREGLWADIVVFDDETIEDTATFTNPRQYPQGILYVLVNGQIVVDEGEHTGALPGKVLRKK